MISLRIGFAVENPAGFSRSYLATSARTRHRQRIAVGVVLRFPSPEVVAVDENRRKNEVEHANRPPASRFVDGRVANGSQPESPQCFNSTLIILFRFRQPRQF
jgi:hypothetical protein